MMGQRPPQATGAAGKPVFATTHWSVVLATADQASSQSTQALEQLCRTYWYPLYAYVRRRGYSPEDAEDLTQEFFLRLLRKNYLAQVDPSKGKFRSFLLAAINHIMANEWDRTNAVKRGGRVTFLALDLDSAEQRLAETSLERSPEQIFERCWALAFLQEVLGRLRTEVGQAGHATHFEELKALMTKGVGTGKPQPPQLYNGGDSLKRKTGRARRQSEAADAGH